MEFKKRIDAFIKLGNYLNTVAEVYESNNGHSTSSDWGQAIQTLEKAKNENGWFTANSITFALKSWANALTEHNLSQWTSKYDFPSKTNPKTIAVIMAGNIPLVGFHDFLSVLISGHKIIVKLSSNDKVLLPFIANFLIGQEPSFENFILFTEERLNKFDAVIATGSDNTARYFDYYFQKYPHIIRKNRNSVAVLDGTESNEELALLADDIFLYFGLGCRNVSKLYVPEDYNFKNFFEAVYAWKDLIYNNKYMNNYDYNKAVYLMGGIALLDNEFMLLKKDENFSSPIAVVFYEEYTFKEALEEELKEASEKIQCIVSKTGIPNEFSFGEAQHPKLWDYADGIDTLEFLLNLP